MDATVERAPPRTRAPGERMLRRRRILARLRQGWGYDEIARAEKVTIERVRKIVARILKSQVIDDDCDHAQVQLARLETALMAAGEAIADGDLKAIGPYLRVLDRVDRYRGAASARKIAGGEMRKKLLDKLNRMAEAQMDARREEAEAQRLAAPLAETEIDEPWDQPAGPRDFFPETVE